VSFYNRWHITFPSHSVASWKWSWADGEAMLRQLYVKVSSSLMIQQGLTTWVQLLPHRVHRFPLFLGLLRAF
jgi:hypothetical protein